MQLIKQVLQVVRHIIEYEQRYQKIITHPFINPIDTAITTILNKVNNVIRGTSFLNKDKIIGIKNIQVAIKSSTIQYNPVFSKS